MMRTFSIAIIALALLTIGVGCANYNTFIAENIPAAGFDTFSYNRVTGTTSATINATNGKVEDGVLSVEHVFYQENFGPFHNFDITIDNYRRTLPMDK